MRPSRAAFRLNAMIQLEKILADAFSDCPHDAFEMAENAAIDLGHNHRWLQPLAKRVFSKLSKLQTKSAAEIEQIICSDKVFNQRIVKQFSRIEKCPPSSLEQTPTQKPKFTNVFQLADSLGMSAQEVQRIASCRTNYRRKWIRKRTTGFRLIEAPRHRLKSLQRSILRSVVDSIPTHFASHGFTQGRGILSHTRPHANRPVVLRYDLRDFFPSLHVGRVQGMFRSVGYPFHVARLLAQLCVTTCPAAQIEEITPRVIPSEALRLRKIYRHPHLPQGAPTSPAIANCCAFRLDGRLQGFAKSENVSYTRYGDDLLFSGGHNLSERFRWFSMVVGIIALEEGFELNYRKSRRMTQATRQLATGVVLNRRTNIRRDQFDVLKATLHNCVKQGPESQNHANHTEFRSHLQGRISWVAQLNFRRAQKLQRVFDQIDWER